MIEKLIEELGALGWSLPSGPVSAPVSAPSATIGETTSGKTNSGPFNRSIFDEARALLSRIPNRDVLPNITRTSIDDWLDEYPNWVSVAYALIAFLGVAARTPEALAIWCDWSDGRAQTQSSESVWRSALGQPSRFGADGLVRLVNRLAPEKSDFPDIDPDDPMAPDPTPLWDKLRANWAFCASKGFIDMENRIVLARQAFSDKHACRADGLKSELGFPRKQKISVADMFLAQRTRQEVRDVTYAPGDPVLIPTDDPAAPTFNTWRATAVRLQPVTALDVKPWLDHLLFVLGSDNERDRFLRWCAFVALYPQFKPNWHYLIMSVEGLGKDTMVAPLKAAVGAGNWEEELIYALVNNFNAVVEHKLLIVGETAQPKQGFVSAHDYGTKLKPLLAQPPTMIEINRKYMQPYKIPNRLAVILFSNEDNPLHLERGQRRVHVVNRRSNKKSDPGYYWTLHEWLRQGGDALAAAYLLQYPLSDADIREFVGGVAPETDDKVELEQLNAHPQLAALEDMIADARKGMRDGTPFNLVASADELAQLIKEKGSHRPTSRLVARWLYDMEKQGTGVRRLRVDPNEPSACGVVNALGHSGRLWLLADTNSEGKLWSTLTTSEIVAIWKNLTPPKSATVTPIRSAKGKDYPDDEGEERV